MKRPLQLSLAIALALGATNAFALGLGTIQVQSGLNQPLVAEIPIIQSAPGEAEGLIVQLASDEDFERIGMSRSSIGMPVQFSLGKNARGEPVIKITTQEIVREPFVGLLLEANWPKGRLLREYTALLDPPIMAPAVKGSSAVAVAAKEPAATAVQTLPAAKPAASPPPAAASAAPAKPAKPSAETAPKAAPAPRTAGGNEYGPVAAGETLGEIARATRPDESVSINQMMLALLKSNPNAFFKDNINALKRGAVLRIPSGEEVAANGSAREAAAAVRTQIDEWRGSVASAPTLVADTTPATAKAPAQKSGSASSASSGERLALVPPLEGKAGQQSADRPSGGRAGGSGDSATKAELARVKEALTSKEQETGELKSRVKDLEDIRGKNEKLINLQSSELAELRDKLKKMQDDAAKAAATAAATKAEPPLATATAKPPTPAAEPPKAEPASADAKITKDDIWGATDTAKPAASTAAATAGAPESAPAPAGPNAAPPTATPPATTVEKAPPAVAKTEPKAEVKKPVAAVKPAPVVEAPWYLEPWALGAAGVGGLLLVVLGIFGLRKRKPVVSTARTSIASSFGDSPIGIEGSSASIEDTEEQELIEQVRNDPTNAGAHLELLSLYYAQGASEKFEAAAEEMYAYVADPNQPSWREVRTMGEELVPHNPLFSREDLGADTYGGDAGDGEYHFDEPEVAETADFPDFKDDAIEPDMPESSMKTAAMPALDISGFDLGETKPPAPAASADTSFSFDLPPIEEAPSMDEPAIDTPDDLPEVGETPDGDSDDEFFAGEDAIGTKLDLAKAYLDMGDPEGARSMLEEVLAEGAPSQQDEARKLINEIG